MPGLDLLISSLDAHDCQPKRFGGKWRAKCPSHNSRGHSLQVLEGRDAPMVNCFAGCTWQEVLESLGLKWSDLKDDKAPVHRKKKDWERHLETAVRSGAKPVRVAEGVYHGLCTCGGQLYVGRAGAACDNGCRISLDPVPPRFIDPVSLAESFGADLRYSGNGVSVGTCPSCKGWLSVGPGGACCESNCPIEEVGFQVRSLRDSNKGAVMQEKVINILGCIEKKSGVSKAGRPYTIYQVHANDEQGQPIQQELTSFEELPQGQGKYWIEVKEGPYGTQYQVKTSLSPIQREIGQIRSLIDSLEARVTRLEGPPPATAAAQAMSQPTNVTPIAPAEVGDVPF